MTVRWLNGLALMIRALSLHIACKIVEGPAVVVSRGRAITSMWCVLIAVEAQSCLAQGQENKGGTDAKQTARPANPAT